MFYLRMGSAQSRLQYQTLHLRLDNWGRHCCNGMDSSCDWIYMRMCVPVWAHFHILRIVLLPPCRYEHVLFKSFSVEIVPFRELCNVCHQGASKFYFGWYGTWYRYHIVVLVLAVGKLFYQLLQDVGYMWIPSTSSHEREWRTGHRLLLFNESTRLNPAFDNLPWNSIHHRDSWANQAFAFGLTRFVCQLATCIWPMQLTKYHY